MAKRVARVADGEELMDLLAEALDCRESLLPGSSKRVRDHATRFAKPLGLSAKDRSALERAALLRDIGKLKIPNEILLMEVLLSYEESALLHQHPRLGSEVLEETRALRDVAEIVRCHHESFDGDGYPDGLEGEAIPYLARILKIVDVYCAMTSPRAYRQGHASHKEALAHLTEERGKHFDAALVDVFVKEKVGQAWEG